jgi:hypothetical protein
MLDRVNLVKKESGPLQEGAAFYTKNNQLNHLNFWAFSTTKLK